MKILSQITLLLCLLFAVGCSDDDPQYSIRPYHLDEDVRLQAVQKELVTINDEASFKALFESNAPESGIDFSYSSLVFVWGETSGELVDVFKEVLPRAENYLLNVSVTTSSHVSATRTWFVGYIVPKFKAANFTLQLSEHSL